MTKLAIFASGTGTNARAIIAHFQDNDQIDVGLVVTNKPTAGVIEVAKENGIEYVIVGKDELNDAELMLALLDEYDIKVIILAGWLLLMPASLVRAFKNRILNIHPALLPKFGGKGMWGHHVHQAVLESAESESGITIHLVNEVYDDGKIIAQFRVELNADETVETIEQKVRALELKHYAPTIEAFIERGY